MDNYQSVDFKILQSGFVAAFIATVFTFSPVGIGIAVAAYTAVAVNDSVRNYRSIKGIANEFPHSRANKMLNRQALVLAFATFLNFATFYISSVVGDNVSDKSMLAGLRVGIRGYNRIKDKAQSKLDQSATNASDPVSPGQTPARASDFKPSEGLDGPSLTGSGTTPHTQKVFDPAVTQIIASRDR